MPQGSQQLKEEKLTLVAGTDPRPLSACARGQIRVQNQAPRPLWQPLRLARNGPQLHRKQRRGLPLSAARGRLLGVDQLWGAGTFPPWSDTLKFEFCASS